VKKEGYQPVQTALQVRQGTSGSKLSLESLAEPAHRQRPPGADVFINGAKQSGRLGDPALAAGQYNLVLRLQATIPLSQCASQGQQPNADQYQLNLRSSNHVVGTVGRSTRR